METFSFNPPINVVEEGKELLAAISFEATNCNFKTSDENNSFSIGTPGYWRIPNFLPEGIIDRLKKLIELRCQSDNELRVKEVKKRGTRIQTEKKGYSLSGFDHFKSVKLSELRLVKYHDLDDMIYRMALTYEENMEVLETRRPASTGMFFA